MAKSLTQNLTISMKIGALVAVLVVFTIMTGVGYQMLVGNVRDLGVEETSKIMMEGYERELQELVDSQAILLGTAVANLDGEEAKKQEITRLLADVRFDPNKTGYYFVYEPNGTVITVPPKPALAGKNLIGLKDKKDRLFIQDLLDVAKNGGGFVEYFWDKGDNNIQPKLSYARLIPGTNYMIGTGVYIDDIAAEENKVLATIHDTTSSFLMKLLAFVLGAFVVIIVPMTWFLIMSIIKPVRSIQSAVTEVSTGKLDVQLEGEYGGEMGKLKQAVEEMVAKLKHRAVVAQAIADGDISMTVTVESSEDVLGQAMRTMTDRLNDLLGQIQIAGDQITSGANQVADSSQTLSHGATQQASAVEEISSSMTELASQTKQNAENAGMANKLGEDMQSAAGRGTDQMESMVKAMHEINDAGQSISNIIKTIDEIAFQTNLLALNAAVEAARAGQHGKGFAVVAEEVRNLAARSAKAASETAELIEGSVKKGESGVEIADRTAAALNEIVSGITKSNDLIGEIAASSSEQAEGISQMNQGLQQIDTVTQQNTATAEESAASAEELSSQTAHLQSMIRQFKLRAGAMGAPTYQAPVAQKPVAAPAPHPTPPAPPKPVAVAAPAAATSEWGGGSAQPQIALDDDDFGKY